jgi:hypothetical protein
MAQLVTPGRAQNSPESSKLSGLETLAILMAWSLFLLMLFAVGTALKNGL